MYCSVYFLAFIFSLTMLKAEKRIRLSLILECFENQGVSNTDLSFALLLNCCKNLKHESICKSCSTKYSTNISIICYTLYLFYIFFSVIGAPFIKVPPVEITVAKGEDFLC
jgi:hypothetical protein